MFVSKSRTDLIKRHLHHTHLQISDSAGNACRDKHSSIFGPFINYKGETFIALTL
jgi:hypothetical protein